VTQHRLHVAAALLHLFLLPLSTAGGGLSFLVLVGVAAARLPQTASLYPALLRRPTVWLLGAFVLWSALSLAWTSDPVEGLADLRALRMALLPLLLWPLSDRAPQLVGAVLCGVAAQNGAQLLQLLGWVDLRPWDAAPERLGGTVHPIQTGAFCLAALCWHACAIARSRGSLRLLSAAGGVAALLGLLGSQSRGPWLAALFVLPVELLALGITQQRARRALLAASAAGLAAMLLAWPLVDEVVERRVRVAFEQLAEARENGVCTSNVGLRLCHWRWSWEMFRDAPLSGVGVGGYRDAQRLRPSFVAAVEQSPERASYLERKHPHHAALDILATSGLVGLLLAAGALALALRDAVRNRAASVYALGTVFVLLAWALGSLFDAYNLSGRLMGLLMLAVALALGPAPGLSPARGSAESALERAE